MWRSTFSCSQECENITSHRMNRSWQCCNVMQLENTNDSLEAHTFTAFGKLNSRRANLMTVVSPSNGVHREKIPQTGKWNTSTFFSFFFPLVCRETKCGQYYLESILIHSVGTQKETLYKSNRSFALVLMANGL